MEKSIALLLLLSPFVGFVINILFGNKLSKTLVGILASTAIASSFLATLYFFVQVSSTNVAITFDLFQWINLENFSINVALNLDRLSVLWLLFVTGIGFLIHLYSISYMHNDENFHKFFGYLNLFVFFMITLVIANNLLLMFIGWEGVGLCSYLLIGFWHTNQAYNDAAKKAFIMNRVGDLGLLIGLFILVYLYKTLNYSDLQSAVALNTNPEASYLIPIAAFCLFIGATGKSAQLPLYTWLPDAMAGPTPVSALIHAATMVTAGIFMITKMHFLFELAPQVQTIITIVGAATALLAASIGLIQHDIKKVLAYSTVSQLGFMFVALGFGAYEVAVFHVITHAFFKACLFLGSGSVIHALHGEQDMRNMGGLRKIMPITFITMFISSLAIAGIFPLSGFWSKDEILMTAFHGNPIIWVMLSIASIFTAFYMFRLMFSTFFNEFRGTEKQKNQLHESPALITVPLVILAILAAIGGALSLPGMSWLNSYLAPVLTPNQIHAHHLGMTEYALMAFATLGAIVGIAVAFYKYISKHKVPKPDVEVIGFANVLLHTYYLDELYKKIFVNPIYKISQISRNYLETSANTGLESFATITKSIGNQGKKIHNGSIGLYLFVFVFGFSSLLIYLILLK